MFFSCGHTVRPLVVALLASTRLTTSFAEEIVAVSDATSTPLTDEPLTFSDQKNALRGKNLMITETTTPEKKISDDPSFQEEYVIEDEAHELDQVTPGFSQKFVIMNPESGKVLDAYACGNGANVEVWSRYDTWNQIYHYHYDTKAIVNVSCNKALRKHDGCDNGNNIYLGTHNTSGVDENQEFVFYPDGTICSPNCNSPWQCLDISTDAFNGDNVKLLPDNIGRWDQQWKRIYITNMTGAQTPRKTDEKQH